MASKKAAGRQSNEMNPIEEEDALNCVVAKLSVFTDFFRLMGDDSILLDANTPLGLYLIMGECIDTLKKL